MDDEARRPSGRPSPGRRAGPAERRERHATVEDPQVVLDAALHFLEVRSRSVAEVRRRLTGAGYRPGLVDDAIARLVEVGMLDDAAFARAWVESRDRAHPRGASALRQELRLRGVDDETVRRVLAERADAEHAPDTGGSHPAVEAEEAASADERAALRLLERRRTGLARYGDPLERRRRAYAMLARSGFDPEVCRRVAATVVGRTAHGDGGGLDLEDRLDEGP